MKKTFDTKSIVVLGLLTALTLVFSFTHIGTIPIGPLSITLNVIPIALAAVVLGPVGGATIGAIFGFCSFLQCLGIGVPSAMGAILFEINPFFAFVQRFVPRVLVGLLVGFVYKGVQKISNTYVSCAVAGFCSAFFNTALFMSALVLLYSNTEYVQGLMGSKNVILFICSFVGINAVCEMICSTIVTAAVGAALYKAKVLPAPAAAKKTNLRRCA